MRKEESSSESPRPVKIPHFPAEARRPDAREPCQRGIRLPSTRYVECHFSPEREKLSTSRARPTRAAIFAIGLADDLLEDEGDRARAARVTSSTLDIVRPFERVCTFIRPHDIQRHANAFVGCSSRADHPGTAYAAGQRARPNRGNVPAFLDMLISSA